MFDVILIRGFALPRARYLVAAHSGCAAYSAGTPSASKMLEDTDIAVTLSIKRAYFSKFEL